MEEMRAKLESTGIVDSNPAVLNLRDSKSVSESNRLATSCEICTRPALESVEASPSSSTCR